MTEFSDESKYKISRAMRSLFRFSRFEENYPDVLVETEKNILKNCFNDLTAEEIIYVVQHSKEYIKEESVRFEVENDRLFALIKQELSQTN